ncbi:MAG: hypothetical protein LBT42_00550 [Tannerella sp.]|jgi:hypothetical protein|nr:hypothetical protein [Tannerella sp.]
MAVLQVTSKQFKEKQKLFFDMADSGKQIVIKRGGKQAYTLTPVNDDDMYFTPEMTEKIKHSLQQAKEGKVTGVASIEELHNLLDSL